MTSRTLALLLAALCPRPGSGDRERHTYLGTDFRGAGMQGSFVNTGGEAGEPQSGDGHKCWMCREGGKGGKVSELVFRAVSYRPATVGDLFSSWDEPYPSGFTEAGAVADCFKVTDVDASTECKDAFGSVFKRFTSEDELADVLKEVREAYAALAGPLQKKNRVGVVKITHEQLFQLFKRQRGGARPADKCSMTEDGKSTFEVSFGALIKDAGDCCEKMSSPEGADGCLEKVRQCYDVLRVTMALHADFTNVQKACGDRTNALMPKRKVNNVGYVRE